MFWERGIRNEKGETLLEQALFVNGAVSALTLSPIVLFLDLSFVFLTLSVATSAHTRSSLDNLPLPVPKLRGRECRNRVR